MDIYPDFRKGKMTIWLRNNKHGHKVVDDFEPVFYLEGDVPETLERSGFKVRKVKKKVAPGTGPYRSLFEISPGRTMDPRSYVSAVDFFEGYGRREFYDVDLMLEHRYMVEKDISPMTLVEWDGGWKKVGDRYEMDPTLPDLRTVELDVVVGGRRSLNSPMDHIVFNDEVIDGTEEDMIKKLGSRLKRYDPDVVITQGGDTFLLPYLYYRSELLDIPLVLGREPSMHLPREGRSHESYGRVIYRPEPQMLRGRIHIDSNASFMYSQSGWEGLVEVSRLANIPLQKMARYSPGRAVDCMEIEHALRDGYVIPWKKNMVEDIKTLDHLLKADRGGITYVPEVGIHRDVVKLDFASMYPSIIVRYNISPDTMGCDCGNDRVVPGLGYSICREKKGLIPRAIEPVLERRRIYKSRSCGNDGYARKAQALKWLLVTCFGYTGYKKARFSKIEVHESITAYGRETLLKAADIAMDMGYEVIHGIVDSLWLKGDIHGISELLARVEYATGVELEHEGTYGWVCFSADKQDRKIGVPTRYFGVLDGEPEVKGLYLKRHDTPPYFKNVQKEMIGALGKKGEINEDVFKVVKRAMIELREENVSYDDLTFTKKFSGKRGLSYGRAAYERYRDAGIEVKPGQMVKYVIKGAGKKRAEERVITPYDDDDPYDRKAYETYLFRVAEEITSPFGIWREDIERIVKKVSP